MICSSSALLGTITSNINFVRRHVLASVTSPNREGRGVNVQVRLDRPGTESVIGARFKQKVKMED